MSKIIEELHKRAETQANKLKIVSEAKQQQEWDEKQAEINVL